MKGQDHNMTNSQRKAGKVGQEALNYLSKVHGFYIKDCPTHRLIKQQLGMKSGPGAMTSKVKSEVKIKLTMKQGKVKWPEMLVHVFPADNP